MIKKPIFVVGCGRSGTTLFFDILSSHPALARTTGYPDGEDHHGWIEHGQCVMAGIGNVHHSKYGNGINGYQYCLHMTREDVTDEIVCNMHEYYWRDVLREDPERRILNKQPHLSNKLDYLLSIFPDAKIVHIIRDCEPTVASWLALMEQHPSLMVFWPKGEAFPCLWLMPKPDDPLAAKRLQQHSQFFPGGGAELFIEYWNEINSGIPKQMAGRESQLISVRYEDLVAEPQDVLSRVLSFAELPDFEFRVDHIERNTAAKHVHRMKERLRAIIAEKARAVRAQFGYGQGPRERLASSLYMP